MVGNELGAGKLEKAKEYGRRLCHLSVSSGIVSGLVLLAFSPLILRAANLSVTAEGYLKGMLLICAYYTGRGWLCKELVFIRIKNIFVWSFSVCED